MTKIILLGGSGFIGKTLLPLLQKENFELKTLVHKNSLTLSQDSFAGDICAPGLLDMHLSDDDVIINLIGQVENDFTKFVDNNLIGGVNLLNSSIKKKNIRIILISSIGVYGENLERLSKESDIPNPQTPYGIVKLITEKLYQHYSISYGIDVTVLRMSTLYGPSKTTGHIARLIHSIKTGDNTVAYNNGNQKRDLLFVNDAVHGIIQAVKNPQKGYEVFNISSSTEYTIKEIIQLIEKISNKKLHVTLSPDVPDEKSLSADNSLARAKLQFVPHTKIEDGLQYTIEYFLKNNS